jgi:hypothetical protein
MKQEKTWVYYLGVSVFVAFVLAGVALAVFAVGFAMAMGSWGSNK